MEETPVQEWFTYREIADMRIPGLPNSKRGFDLLMKRKGLLGPQHRRRGWGKYPGRGGVPFEYHISVIERFARGQGIEVSTLPSATDAALLAELSRRTGGSKRIIIRVAARTRRM